jgi:hypothetical protein
MSVSTAIGMVSVSLRSLLIGEMQLTPAVDVTVLAPDEGSSDRRINLFLYKLEENRFLKNQDFTVKPGDPNRLVAPPLSLNLFYLMTPYAPNDPQTGNATRHQILGEAMRVFFEHPVVPDSYLDSGLADARERLQIASNAVDAEELSRIWSTFSRPFRLSVLYQVSTVQLDALPATQRPLPKRVREVGVPGVRQPPARPAVTGMSPPAGVTGTALTFTGEYLGGWRASVSVGGQTVLDDQALTGGEFGATVPAGLLPGFYDVRVEVSGLFRRTFLFEVTP